MTSTQHELARWVGSMKALLEELGAQRFDYPLGDNIVRERSSSPAAVPHALAGLYDVCDGLSMPDVHVGYFIDPSARVSSAALRGEPVRIAGASSPDITVLGSDGGGGRFAIGRDLTVHHLPSGGAVVGGAYVESARVKARRVASSLLEFLWLLHSDLEAFVRAEEKHHYIVG